MKLTATLGGYSSIVGQSILLHDENGKAVCQLAMLNIGERSHKELSNQFGQFVTDKINGQPFIPPSPVQPTASVEAVAFPAYGEMPFSELGSAVKAAQFGSLQPYEFDPEFYPGHQIVGTINFNSLNRIVTWFVKRALASLTPAATQGGGVREARGKTTFGPKFFTDVGRDPAKWVAALRVRLGTDYPSDEVLSDFFDAALSSPATPDYTSTEVRALAHMMTRWVKTADRQPSVGGSYITGDYVEDSMLPRRFDRSRNRYLILLKTGPQWRELEKDIHGRTIDRDIDPPEYWLENLPPHPEHKA